jgi:hypothetical protein
MVMGNGFILPDLLPGHSGQIWGRGDALVIPVEAIDRLIDDFRTRIEKLRPFAELEYVNGGMMAYEMAIRELQKVVDDYGPGKP